MKNKRRIEVLNEKIDDLCKGYDDIPWGKNGYLTQDKEKFELIYKEIKKIKKQEQKYSCCYCNVSLIESHEMIIDVEHILPKSIFNRMTFVLDNLSISCKRCNMGIKSDDLSFFNKNESEFKKINDEKKVGLSSDYKIIHPNLDNIYTYMHREEISIDGFKLTLFKLNNNGKGEYHKSYFQLGEITRSCLDAIQGIEPRKNYLRASSIDLLKGDDGLVHR